jgi:hypothetical protein
MIGLYTFMVFCFVVTAESNRVRRQLFARIFSVRREGVCFLPRLLELCDVVVDAEPYPHAVDFLGFQERYQVIAGHDRYARPHQHRGQTAQIRPLCVFVASGPSGTGRYGRDDRRCARARKSS